MHQGAISEPNEGTSKTGFSVLDSRFQVSHHLNKNNEQKQQESGTYDRAEAWTAVHPADP